MITIMPIDHLSDGGAIEVDPKDAKDWMVIREGGNKPFERHIHARQDKAIEVARQLSKREGYGFGTAILSTKTLGSSAISLAESCGASEFYVVPMEENEYTGELTVCADEEASIWGLTKRRGENDIDHDPIDAVLARFNSRAGADRLLSNILDYRDPPVEENNEDFTD